MKRILTLRLATAPITLLPAMTVQTPMTRRVSPAIFASLFVIAACSQSANPTRPSPLAANDVAVSSTAQSSVPPEGGWGTMAAPLPPSNLSYSVLDNSLRLSWEPPPGGDPPTSYVIEAGSSPGASDRTPHGGLDTGSTERVFSAIGVPDGTYYIRVRARNASGVSAPTADLTARVGAAGPVPCGAPPNAPTNLTTTVSGTTVAMAWSPPEGGCAPDGYVIEYGTQAGQFPGSLSIGPTTSYVVPNVPRGTYYLRVRARNAAGVSAPTNSTTATPGAAAPPPPTVTCRQCLVDYNNAVAGCENSYRNLIELNQCINRAIATWLDCQGVCVPPYDPFAAPLRK